MPSGRGNTERQQARRRRRQERSQGSSVDEAPEVTGGAASSAGADGDAVRRPATRGPDNGLWRSETDEDWVARGVSAETVPRIDQVIRLAHRHRWPLRVVEEDGWTCVLIPCFTDLPDAMERILRANEAVAPDSEGDGDAAAASAAPSSASGVVAPAASQPLVDDLVEGIDELAVDADGITWLGPARSGQRGAAP